MIEKPEVLLDLEETGMEVTAEAKSLKPCIKLTHNKNEIVYISSDDKSLLWTKLAPILEQTIPSHQSQQVKRAACGNQNDDLTFLINESSAKK